MKEYMTLWNQHMKLVNRHYKMVPRVEALEAELQASTSMMASYKEMMEGATGDYLEALDDLWGIANYKRIKAKQGLKKNNWEQVVRMEGKISGLAAQMKVLERYILPQTAAPQAAAPMAAETEEAAALQENAQAAQAAQQPPANTAKARPEAQSKAQPRSRQHCSGPACSKRARHGTTPKPQDPAPAETPATPPHPVFLVFTPRSTKKEQWLAAKPHALPPGKVKRRMKKLRIP